MEKRPLQYWLRLILLLGVIGFSLVVLPVVLPFIIAFIVALILLPVVNGLQDFFQKTCQWTWFPRWVAILISFCLLALFMVFGIHYVVAPVLSELSKLIQNLPYLLNQLMYVLKDLQGLDGQAIVPHQFDSLLVTSIERISNYGIELAQRGISAIFSLAGIVLQLLLVPIVTFYLLKDGRSIKYKFIGVFSEPTSSHVLDVLHDIHRTLGGYLRGQLLLAINMFCWIFVVTYVYDLPYPLVLALLGAIAEWIPIIGPFISAVPAIILAAVISGPLAVKVAITYFVIQLIDGQIIMPKVMGRVIQLQPLTIIFMIFIGGYFYGVIGMMTAVPLTAIMQIIAQRLWCFDEYYKQ